MVESTLKSSRLGRLIFFVWFDVECVCARLVSHVGLFAIPWTVAHQTALSMRFFQARILGWVAMFSSRGSSRPEDWTCLLHLLHWQVYSLPLSHLESPVLLSEDIKSGVQLFFWPNCTTCGIFFFFWFNQELNPDPQHWEHRALPLGPPDNS